VLHASVVTTTSGRTSERNEGGGERVQRVNHRPSKLTSKDTSAMDYQRIMLRLQCGYIRNPMVECRSTRTIFSSIVSMFFATRSSPFLDFLHLLP
jgi:hypothetical protein